MPRKETAPKSGSTAAPKSRTTRKRGKRQDEASALKDDAFRAGIREGDPEVMKRLVLWDFIIGVATVTP